MTRPITLTPTGIVRGGRGEIFEDRWGGVTSRLVLDPAVVDEDATPGLGEFSHLKVIFCFDCETWVRRSAAHHPRGLSAGRHADTAACEAALGGSEMVSRGEMAVPRTWPRSSAGAGTGGS
jgi:hypothetical protein